MAKPIIATPPANHALRTETRAGGRGISAFVQLRMTNWLRRRRLTRIEDLDDRILDDIGLTRADVMWARSLPLDQNPIAALNAVAFERRAMRDRQQRRRAIYRAN